MAETMTEIPMRVTFLELELTRRCPLACGHCYNESGPTSGHGSMTTVEWEHVITDAAAAGVETVQFIGGEPTAHPDFGRLLRHAIAAGLGIEVFSNLVAIRDTLWNLLTQPQVSLATSYYSDSPSQHDTITQRRGSHARTRANIAQAVRRGIPIRVGIIDVGDGQRIAQAGTDLRSLGVTRISTDRVRGIGRGPSSEPTVDELCGHCGRGMAAVTSDGTVRPCVMSRWMSAGSVKDKPLAQILNGAAMRELVEAIPVTEAVCNPDCKPSRGDGSDCAPAETETCGPSYCNPDMQ